MQAIILDDWRSILHLVLGIITYFFRPLALVFTAYELVELFTEADDFEHTVGDFLEYFTGVALAHLLLWWI